MNNPNSNLKLRETEGTHLRNPGDRFALVPACRRYETREHLSGRGVTIIDAIQKGSDKLMVFKCDFLVYGSRIYISSIAEIIG